MGIVYLLQPQEYLKTKVYKIGMSSKDNLDAPLTNGNNSFIFLIMNCSDAFNTEIKIRKEFKKNFRLYQGTKFFKGDIDKMKKLFVNIFMKYGFELKKSKQNDSDEESVESVSYSESEIESEKSISEYDPESDVESNIDSENESFDDEDDEENGDDDDDEDMIESEEESAFDFLFKNISKPKNKEDDDITIKKRKFNPSIKPSKQPTFKSEYDSEPNNKKRKFEEQDFTNNNIHENDNNNILNHNGFKPKQNVFMSILPNNMSNENNNAQSDEDSVKYMGTNFKNN